MTFTLDSLRKNVLQLSKRGSKNAVAALSFIQQITFRGL